MAQHRLAVKHGSSLAERVVESALAFRPSDLYDVLTAAEFAGAQDTHGTFAQLVRVVPEVPAASPHYRVCLLDHEILSFLDRNPDIDLTSFITFIMTHELLHIHRFITGRADFEGDPVREEATVDALTRVVLARYPVIGMKRVLSLLDRLKAAPLYNGHILNETRCVNAYL